MQLSKAHIHSSVMASLNMIHYKLIISY